MFYCLHFFHCLAKEKKVDLLIELFVVLVTTSLSRHVYFLNNKNRKSKSRKTNIGPLELGTICLVVFEQFVNALGTKVLIP